MKSYKERLEATFDGTIPLDGTRLAAEIARTVPEANAEVYAKEFHERLARIRRAARERARLVAGER